MGVGRGVRTRVCLHETPQSTSAGQSAPTRNRPTLRSMLPALRATGINVNNDVWRRGRGAGAGG